MVCFLMLSFSFQTERLYFKVVLPHDETSELASQAMFFSSVWSIGRAIDKVATTVKLRNENNIATAKVYTQFIVSGL